MGGEAILVSKLVRQEISQLMNIDHYVAYLFSFCFPSLPPFLHITRPFFKNSLIYIRFNVLVGFILSTLWSKSVG